MPPIIIYHANCHDGFCAAWLFHHVFPDAEFVPAHHGTDPPNVAGKDVYMLDFTYKRPIMEQLVTSAASIAVLDHHKAAEEDLAGLAITGTTCKKLDIIFDMSMSGGRLAWEYLTTRIGVPMPPEFPPESCPWLVNYTEDRDLWRWNLPHSREINAAIRHYPLAFGQWDEWHKYSIRSDKFCKLVLEGESILKCEKSWIDSHVLRARLIRLCGHDVRCVNASVLYSEIAGELAKGYPFGLCYFQRHDGIWQYELRSGENGIDVSEVAKQFGGGGHHHAAGFQSVEFLL